MAKIYPVELDAETPESERRIFQRLRTDLPEDWTVFHARRFLLPRGQGQRPMEGEVDFLVVDPTRGYLALEVKGGGISRHHDGWSSVDRHGVRHAIKTPGRQAQHAVHAIARYLRDTGKVEAIAYGWGVVFPDVDAPSDLGPELPREVVIDRRDLKNTRAAVDRVFRFQIPEPAPLSNEIRQSFVRALAPRLHLVPSLAIRMEAEDQILVRLTEEQMEILDVLAEIPRLAIKGSAGTGKTLVAMERARRLASDGKRVLLLCYNRPLADFLSHSAQGFTVTNFHGLCRELARSAGIRFEAPKGEASATFWESTAPDLLNQALDLYPDERWDAVIVDEGQDFHELWWLVVERLLRDPSKAVLWIFFDPNQNLYGGGPTEALGLQAASLTWNCRNTANIAKHASGLVDLTPKLKAGTPEGSEVQRITCADEAAMVDAVRKLLHRWVNDEGIEPARIQILSPRGPSSPVRRHERLGNFTLTDEPGRRPGPGEVRYSSLQRFKGLEADAVILCDVDFSKPSCSPQHLYVGTSRAKHVLAVLAYGPGAT